MIVSMRYLLMASIFTILDYFTHFESPQGSKGAQNRLNVPIFSKIVIGTYIFGWIYSTWEI